MSLITYLNRLRSEPEEKRRRVAWLWTIAITVVIVVGWFFTTWRSNQFFVAQTDRPSTDQGQKISEIKLKIITGWQTLTKTE